MKKVIVKAQCYSCGGTGLYKGFAEHGKCAMVCQVCNGTGCSVLSYTPFEKRKRRKDVDRVFKSSCGYGHSSEDVHCKDGRIVEFSRSGCTYLEWLAGADPRPVKELYCPYLWENQNMQNKSHSKHKMYKDRCEDNLSMGMSITDCKCYKEKHKCWEVYER